MSRERLPEKVPRIVRRNESVPRQSPLKIVQLTPAGRGAVATLLVEGPGALEAVESRFRSVGSRPLASYHGDRLAFGHFHFGSSCGEELFSGELTRHS